MSRGENAEFAHALAEPPRCNRSPCVRERDGSDERRRPRAATEVIEIAFHSGICRSKKLGCFGSLLGDALARATSEQF